SPASRSCWRGRGRARHPGRRDPQMCQRNSNCQTPFYRYDHLSLNSVKSRLHGERGPMEIETATATRTAWRPVAAVATSATVFTTPQGLTYPLLALILDRAGIATWLIGANAAMTPLGMMAAAVAAAQIVHRFGAYRLAVASLLGAALCVVALGAVQDAI